MIGEGYRLIGECEAGDAVKTQMLLVAARGQRELCRGQGAELVWARDPQPLASKQVLEIFRQKTGPGLRGRPQARRRLRGPTGRGRLRPRAVFRNLGIAYQIRDDMDDLGADAGDNELEQMRPSVLLAVARERAKGDDKAVLDALWTHAISRGIEIHKIRSLAHSLEADEKCLLLFETYKEAAVRALADLENANLKGLLRRVMGKIFNDLEIKAGAASSR